MGRLAASQSRLASCCACLHATHREVFADRQVAAHLLDHAWKQAAVMQFSACVQLSGYWITHKGCAAAQQQLVQRSGRERRPQGLLSDKAEAQDLAGRAQPASCRL